MMLSGEAGRDAAAVVSKLVSSSTNVGESPDASSSILMCLAGAAAMMTAATIAFVYHAFLAATTIAFVYHEFPAATTIVFAYHEFPAATTDCLFPAMAAALA